jgi:hypothetical protein
LQQCRACSTSAPAGRKHAESAGRPQPRHQISQFVRRAEPGKEY